MNEQTGAYRPGQPPWRVGRQVGQTIYDAHGVLIGLMDTPDLAAYVVHAANLAAPRGHTTEGSDMHTVTRTHYLCAIPGHHTHDYHDCPDLASASGEQSASDSAAGTSPSGRYE